MADIFDYLREPVSATVRSKRVGQYPYFGATGQVGWIDDYRQDGTYVLLGEDGAPFFDKSKPKAYLVRGKCWVNNHAHVLKGMPGVCTDEFLCHALNWADYRDAVSGSTRLKLPQNAMNLVLLPAPSIDEQIAITMQLDCALGEISKARQAIEGQDADVRALYDSILSASVRGDGTSRYQGGLLALGDYCKKIGSGSTPTGGNKSYVSNGIPLIRSQNVLMRSFTREGLAHITPATHAEMSGTQVEPGDVLLNITGASIGRVCVVPDDICPANVNQHVCIIRCGERIDPQFLMLLLSSPEFQKNIDDTQAGGTRQALTKADVMQFQIPALEIDAQRELATKLISQLGEIDAIRLATLLQIRELDLIAQKFRVLVFES